ncbi:MAG: hypothetical protein ACLPVW_18365 [Terriglobales bacterium]
MSVVVLLMIGGWVATLSMIGFCALKESGKLPSIHRRIGLWLEASAPQFRMPEERLRTERKDAI